MSRIKITILFLALCSTAGVPVRAQSALTQSIQPAPAASSAAGPTDPLGRNTPSNAILGFLRAAQDGDYSIAAQYLQMSAARRQTEGEQTVAKLKFVLDHAFSGNLSRYNQPEGTPQEGVPLGRQKLGTMTAGDVEVDLDGVRVSDPSAGRIWLVSADTLAKLPEPSGQVVARLGSHNRPSVLVKHSLGGMP